MGHTEGRVPTNPPHHKVLKAKSGRLLDSAEIPYGIRVTHLTLMELIFPN